MHWKNLQLLGNQTVYIWQSLASYKHPFAGNEAEQESLGVIPWSHSWGVIWLMLGCWEIALDLRSGFATRYMPMGLRMIEKNKLHRSPAHDMGSDHDQVPTETLITICAESTRTQPSRVQEASDKAQSAKRALQAKTDLAHVSLIGLLFGL
jgi:hypothetical protein